MALIPGKEGNRLNADLLERAYNRLPGVILEEAAWANAVRVIDPAGLRLQAAALKQTAICYFEPTL